MKPRDQAIQELNNNGFFFERHGGRHDVYHSEEAKASITLKRHDFDEADLRIIRREIKKIMQRLGH